MQKNWFLWIAYFFSEDLCKFICFKLLFLTECVIYHKHAKSLQKNPCRNWETCFFSGFLLRNSHKIKFIFMPFSSSIKVGCSFANPAFTHLNFNTILYSHIQLASFWDTEHFYKTKIVTRKQNDISEESTFQSHEGARTKKSYTLKFKSDAIKYAELSSNRAAAKKISVDVKQIREWKTNKTRISEQSIKPKRK